MAEIPKEMMDALGGLMPSACVTCSADGVPNTTYLSQVFYAGPGTIAISRQFFGKTAKNLRENPLISLSLLGGAHYWRVLCRYARTETEGDMFDDMEMQLEVLASMQGQEGVFELKGADILEVLEVERLT
jgi:uncharacterized protein